MILNLLHGIAYLRLGGVLVGKEKRECGLYPSTKKFLE